MNKYNHLMLDIETLGSKSGSVICSIGAVPFNLETGETGTPFYEKINGNSCIEAGLKMDFDTIVWWSKQSPEAFQEMLSGSTPLKEALYRLTIFISQQYENPDEMEIWGNGSRFDHGIVSDAYQAIGMPIPWNFGKERDVRTLLRLRPDAKEMVTKPTMAHQPVDDCLFQIAYCSKVIELINGKNPDRTINISINHMLFDGLKIETLEGINNMSEKIHEQVSRIIEVAIKGMKAS